MAISFFAFCPSILPLVLSLLTMHRLDLSSLNSLVIKATRVTDESFHHISSTYSSFGSPQLQLVVLTITTRRAHELNVFGLFVRHTFSSKSVGPGALVALDDVVLKHQFRSQQRSGSILSRYASLITRCLC